MDQGTVRALTVGELCERYTAHARVYYRRPDGSTTREHCNIASSIAHFELAAGATLPAADVSKRDLTLMRRNLVARKLARTYINQCHSRVLRMYKWAVQEELVPPAALGPFQLVPAIAPGRHWQPEPVQACNLRDVVATLPYLPEASQDVVQLLMLTGARASEILRLRFNDLDQDEDGAWWAIPTYHKTSFRNRRRWIPLCATCVAIIQARNPTPLWENSDAVFPGRTQKHFTLEGLRSALRRAFKRMHAEGVAFNEWHPHQIRHAAATIARRAGANLEELQVMLGHSTRASTERYARAFPKAARRAQQLLAREVGL